MAIKQTESFKAYQRAIVEHRRRLDRLLDRRSVLSMKRYFDRAQDKLETHLIKMAKDVHKDPLTPLQVQQLLQVVRQAQAIIAAKLHREYLPIMDEAQTEGIEQTAKTVEDQERRAFDFSITLSISDAAIAAMLKESRVNMLTQQNQKNFANVAQRLTRSMEESLAVSLSNGETPVEAIERIRQTAEDNWWQNERVLHTDLAHTFNLAQADSISEVGKTLPGLMKRWCELVDDLTGLPLDNKVAPDSMVLHGQVAPMSGRFVMPPDPGVHRSFWNQTYFTSPNRPNDRSQTMPWRPGWGSAPGWLWQNGQRVNL